MMTMSMPTTWCFPPSWAHAFLAALFAVPGGLPSWGRPGRDDDLDDYHYDDHDDDNDHDHDD